MTCPDTDIKYGCGIRAQNSSVATGMKSIVFLNKICLPLCLPGLCSWHPYPAASSAALPWQLAEGSPGLSPGWSPGCMQLLMCGTGDWTVACQRWQLCAWFHTLSQHLIPDLLLQTNKPLCLTLDCTHVGKSLKKYIPLERALVDPVSGWHYTFMEETGYSGVVEGCLNKIII